MVAMMMMPANVEFWQRKFWAEWTLTGAHPSRIGHTIMEMMIVTIIVMMVTMMSAMMIMTILNVVELYLANGFSNDFIDDKKEAPNLGQVSSMFDNTGRICDIVCVIKQLLYGCAFDDMEEAGSKGS